MITLADIQRKVGVNPDGKWGPITADAIAKALGIDVPKHELSNSKAFFDAVRSITASLSQTQVDGINAIIDHASHHPLGWVAYELATAWHEARFKPQSEWGKGKGRPYGKPGAYYGQAPYGRGFVQLTWDRNYEWADKRFGMNGALLKNFDLALEPDLAARILVIGMEEGAFTGKKLSDYLTGWRGDKQSFINSRRIVNGTDKADLIAGHAMHFQNALELGGWA